MAAPAAPRIIRAWNNGENIRIVWTEVEDATDYNVYLGYETEPTGLEDSLTDDEAEPNGTFIWYSGVEAGHVYVRVTALNALAEESDYSNEVHKFIGYTAGSITPTPALDHERKRPH